jgi:SAM-dependent methyltransferase
MDDLTLLVDLHGDGDRQGPGSERATRLALELSGLPDRRGLAIADVGCGTGASTRVLARELDADVLAVDLVPAFLSTLGARADREGWRGRVLPVVAPMEALPFEDGSLDAIWSEGAIYRMGFARGVAAWRRLLRPGGILAVSELTWSSARRPADLDAYWRAHYPEVGTMSEKLSVLERAGYATLGAFMLPDSCWTEAFHGPLRARFPAFLARHGFSEAARRIVDEEALEIAFHERHRAHFGYGFYVARRCGDD